MTSEISNDNNGAGLGPVGPDAHGHAAVLLVESLIHGLVEREVLTVSDAVGIIDNAADVKSEIGIEMGDSPASLRRSVTILRSMSGSLSADLVDR